MLYDYAVVLAGVHRPCAAPERALQLLVAAHHHPDLAAYAAVNELRGQDLAGISSKILLLGRDHGAGASAEFALQAPMPCCGVPDRCK